MVLTEFLLGVYFVGASFIILFLAEKLIKIKGYLTFIILYGASAILRAVYDNFFSAFFMIFNNPSTLPIVILSFLFFNPFVYFNSIFIQYTELSLIFLSLWMLWVYGKFYKILKNYFEKRLELWVRFLLSLVIGYLVGVFLLGFGLLNYNFWIIAILLSTNPTFFGVKFFIIITISILTIYFGYRILKLNYDHWIKYRLIGSKLSRKVSKELERSIKDAKNDLMEEKKWNLSKKRKSVGK